jgi:hypothetical protein
MSWGVNYIDAIVAPGDGSIFRENRNATFALLVVRIHNPFGGHAFTIQGAGLLQQFVDEGSFSVVDVSYDGDVT